MTCGECGNEILPEEDREDGPDGTVVHSNCVIRPALASLMRPDTVNHPAHYNRDGIETIDVIEAFQLDFCTGNAVKYILRHKFKHDSLTDLKKARWFLDRRISQLENDHERDG